MKTKTATLSIRITPETKKGIVKAAKASRMSTAGLVEMILAQYLNKIRRTARKD